MKKLVSIVLALCMVLMVGAAFATQPDASNELNHNGTLTITGLEEGDTVNYYKVLEWSKDDPDGWVFTSQFSTVDDSVRQAILNTGITGAIATTLSPLATTAVTSPAGSVSGTGNNVKWTAGSDSTPVEPGLYMVIITPATPGLIYNPVFVASNYLRDADDTSTHNSYALETNRLEYSDSAMTKKSQLILDKTATGDADTTNALNDDDPDRVDVGEVVDFQVVTTMPKYGADYTNPVFKVTDSLVGLTLDQNSIVVKVGAAGSETTLTENNQYTLEKSATGYTVTFKKDYILSDAIPAAGQRIVITYKAEVTDAATYQVNQEENTVDLIFSTNPDDTTGAGRLRDKTNHFTFSIDAAIFGNSSESAHEVVKIGVDKDGNPIEDVLTDYYYQTEHAALEGAVFGLYTDSACNTLYTNDVFDGYAKSNDHGLLNIKGLDAGEYWLKELEAPEGYIKAQNPVKVTITADISTDTEITETIDPDGVNVTVKYITNTLNSYSITFDDGTDTATTTYEITNNGPHISAVSRKTDSEDAEIKNMKGVELPSTGGIGTTIFYIVGGLLLVGAAVILVARKKSND